MTQSASFTSAALRLLQIGKSMFLASASAKKNAEVIKFLGIFENKINFCSNKKSNVSINKSVIENIGISGNIFKLLLRVFSMTGKEE